MSEQADLYKTIEDYADDFKILADNKDDEIAELKEEIEDLKSQLDD